jgi:tetratricopeptide (TPR) repeat protein
MSSVATGSRMALVRGKQRRVLGIMAPQMRSCLRTDPGRHNRGLRIAPGTGGGLLAAALLLGCLLGAAPAAAAESDWWNVNWPYRVKLDCPAGEGDVAFVSVVLADRTTDTGRDLRLVDGAGQAVPFEILQHDPQDRTTLAFRVAANQADSVYLYFGNARAQTIETTRQVGAPAARMAEARNERRKILQQRESLTIQQRAIQQRLTQVRSQAEAAKKSGKVSEAGLTDMARTVQQLTKQLEDITKQLDNLPAPQEPAEPEDPAHWQIRRGVLLKIHRKAQPIEPKTLADLKQLASRSSVEGAGFRRAISDGLNPFGESSAFISHYSGYLKIDQPGEYAFCSASDDGSWIVVNGKTILDWPGPHDWRGANRGQHSGRVTLQPGLAHVEYFHEQMSGPTMAFLGWKPPDQEHFVAVPPQQWLSVRQATAAGYEARNRPLLALADVHVVNTWWVRDSDQQQAALVQCTDQSLCQKGKIAKREWSFGDGLEGTGPNPRHIYFRTGRPLVTLTVTDTRGNHDTVRCSPRIFKIDAQGSEFEYGNERQYVKLAAGYDVDKMQQDDLEGYADFWSHLERWDELAKAAGAYLQRFGDTPAASRLAAVAARAYVSPSQYNPRRADDLLARAISGTKDPRTRQDLLLERARILTWEVGDTSAAEDLYRQVSPATQSATGDLPRELARTVLIGRGDLALLTGDPEQAAEIYKQAMSLAPRKPGTAEEMAKQGGYPYTVEDLLERGEFEWARKTLDQWEDELPAGRLDGYTLFLRGKVLFVEQPGEQAVRYLTLAEKVAPKAVFVPEALWLQANCLMAMGRYQDALPQLQKIRSDYTRSEFFAQAAEKIKECETRPTTSAPATRP